MLGERVLSVQMVKWVVKKGRSKLGDRYFSPTPREMVI